MTKPVLALALGAIGLNAVVQLRRAARNSEVHEWGRLIAVAAAFLAAAPPNVEYFLRGSGAFADRAAPDFVTTTFFVSLLSFAGTLVVGVVLASTASRDGAMRWAALSTAIWVTWAFLVSTVSTVVLHW